MGSKGLPWRQTPPHPTLSPGGGEDQGEGRLRERTRLKTFDEPHDCSGPFLGVEQVNPHLTRQQRSDIVIHYLELVGLGDAIRKRPAELSAGMRQRHRCRPSPPCAGVHSTPVAPRARSLDSSEARSPVALPAASESRAASDGDVRAAAGAGHSTATDLADWLVRTLKLPFREAHAAVAQAVRFCEVRKCDLADLNLQELRQFSNLIGDDVYASLTLDGAVNARSHIGGTAPTRVKSAIAKARKTLK